MSSTGSDNNALTTDFKHLREQVKMLMFCLGILAFFAFGVVAPQWYFAVGAALGVVALCAFWPMAGLVAMAVMAPFINVEVWWGNMHVPIVDVIALATVVAVVLRSVVRDPSAWLGMTKNGRFGVTAIQRYKIPIAFFLLFVFTAALAVVNAPDVWLSVKYLLRPILFFAIAFLALPVAVIQGGSQPPNVQGSTFSPSRSNLMLWAFVVSGVVVAAMGLVSLYGQVDVAVRRVLPISIFSIYPLGTNHNQIAEVLLVTIPVLWLLREQVKSALAKRALLLASVPVAFVLLATLSRAGWIAFAVEAVVVLALAVRPTFRQCVIGTALIGVLALPFVGSFIRLASAEAGQSANENRWIMTEVAAARFVEHPWIGNGAGSFQALLGADRRYVAKFGDPLDSHGVVQKLLVETGLLGLATFALFWISLLLTFWRRFKIQDLGFKNIEPVLWLALFLGTSVFQLFGTSYFLGRFWLPIGVGLAVIDLGHRSLRITNANESTNSYIRSS